MANGWESLPFFILEKIFWYAKDQKPLRSKNYTGAYTHTGRYGIEENTIRLFSNEEQFGFLRQNYFVPASKLIPERSPIENCSKVCRQWRDVVLSSKKLVNKDIRDVRLNNKIHLNRVHKRFDYALTRKSVQTYDVGFFGDW